MGGIDKSVGISDGRTIYGGVLACYAYSSSQLFILVVVIVSYAAYFVLLLGAILGKNKAVRIGLCIVLAVWFILTLMGFSCWTKYWSV